MSLITSSSNDTHTVTSKSEKEVWTSFGLAFLSYLIIILLYTHIHTFALRSTTHSKYVLKNVYYSTLRLSCFEFRSLLRLQISRVLLRLFLLTPLNIISSNLNLILVDFYRKSRATLFTHRSVCRILRKRIVKGNVRKLIKNLQKQTIHKQTFYEKKKIISQRKASFSILRWARTWAKGFK